MAEDYLNILLSCAHRPCPTATQRFLEPHLHIGARRPTTCKDGPRTDTSPRVLPDSATQGLEDSRPSINKRQSTSHLPATSTSYYPPYRPYSKPFAYSVLLYFIWSTIYIRRKTFPNTALEDAHQDTRVVCPWGVCCSRCNRLGPLFHRHILPWSRSSQSSRPAITIVRKRNITSSDGPC